MGILVAVTTRSGATRKIAGDLATPAGSAITGAGAASDVEVRDVGLISSLKGFDAVLIGGPANGIRWSAPARRRAESFSDGPRPPAARDHEIGVLAESVS